MLGDGIASSVEGGRDFELCLVSGSCVDFHTACRADGIRKLVAVFLCKHWEVDESVETGCYTRFPRRCDEDPRLQRLLDELSVQIFFSSERRRRDEVV
jgi:hypothetical protein